MAFLVEADQSLRQDIPAMGTRTYVSGSPVRPGDRLLIQCDGGPCISRLEVFPPRFEIEERGGLYVLLDDGPLDEWLYQFLASCLRVSPAVKRWPGLDWRTGLPHSRQYPGSCRGLRRRGRRGPKAPSHDCLSLTFPRIPVEIACSATVLRQRPGSAWLPLLDYESAPVRLPAGALLIRGRVSP